MNMDGLALDKGQQRGFTFAVIFSALCGAVLLFLFDPEKGGFLTCPFRSLSGLLCPGCGSQRALHDILHLRIQAAFDHNALLVLSVPLMFLQWLVGRWAGPTKRPSSNNIVVFAWFFLILSWTILRNLS